MPDGFIIKIKVSDGNFAQLIFAFVLSPEKKKQKRKKTMSSLNLMKTSSTLDFHQMTKLRHLSINLSTN